MASTPVCGRKIGASRSFALLLPLLAWLPGTSSASAPDSSSGIVVLAVIGVEVHSPFLEESLTDTFNVLNAPFHVHAEVHVASPRQFSLVDSMKDALSARVDSLTIRRRTPTSFSVARIRRRCEEINCLYFFISDARVHLRHSDTLIHLLSLQLPAVAPVVDSNWGEDGNAEFWELGDEWMTGINRARRASWCVLLNMDVGKLVDKWPHASIHNLTDRLGDTGNLFASTELQYGNMLLPSLPHIGNILSKKQIHSDLWEIILNRREWEERYLHPLYIKKRQTMEFEQPCPRVYWLPLFSRRFCSDIIEVAESSGLVWNNIPGKRHLQEKDLKTNGKSARFKTVDLHLIQIKYHEIFTLFLYHYLQPIEQHLFPWREHTLDGISPFIVRYRRGEQIKLPPHVDEAEVSINVALNEVGVDFNGSGTRFVHHNCTIGSTRLGWALFHPNHFPDDLHEGLPLINGTRYVLVTFLRKKSYLWPS